LERGKYACFAIRSTEWRCEVDAVGYTQEAVMAALEKFRTAMFVELAKALLIPYRTLLDFSVLLEGMVHHENQYICTQCTAGMAISAKECPNCSAPGELIIPLW
jgi:hypothetical protein